LKGAHGALGRLSKHTSDVVGDVADCGQPLLEITDVIAVRSDSEGTN